MHQGKWRIAIREEEWQFSTKTEMMTVISYLNDLKERYGKIKEN